MKFRKHLSVSIESIFPNWADKFLSYKNLKKQLKKIYPDNEHGNPIKRPKLEDEQEVVVEQEVNYFVELLDQEMDKFNEFFLDKEQDYVIKMKVLQDRIAVMNDAPLLELLDVGRQIVEFHGEMVLLKNYSALNYTGLVKILKKYDKRSGALIRKPFIQNVLHQPFYKTDILNNLVKECERMVDQLFSSKPSTAPSPQGNDEPDNEGTGGPEERMHQLPQELEEIRNMENMYLKLTLSALQVLNDTRSRISTVSDFSMPPMMQSEGVQDTLANPPIIEQTSAE